MINGCSGSDCQVQGFRSKASNVVRSHVCTHKMANLSQKEQLQRAGHEHVCLVPGSVDTCMCLIALFNRAATHILRAFYSADIGVMNFGSPLDSVACCLMLVAGRPFSQRGFSSFQLQLSQTRPVKTFCTETDSQCIAYSGVVPEPLLTHDPSRFRVYFTPTA